MADDTKYITIDSDEWEDAGKIYRVVQYTRSDNTNSVELTLEHEGGQLYQRVVPYYSIKWVEGKDYVSF
jgi:hypothetical protein